MTTSFVFFSGVNKIMYIFGKKRQLNWTKPLKVKNSNLRCFTLFDILFHLDPSYGSTISKIIRKRKKGSIYVCSERAKRVSFCV